MRVVDIPGYIEAVLKERLVRDIALLPEVPEKINRFQVVPLTLRHYLILKISQSPFLMPFSMPSEVELIQFLWMLSPGFSKHPRAMRKFIKLCRIFTIPPLPALQTRRAMARWAKKANLRADCFIKTLLAAREYVREAFQDAPPHVENPIPEPSYYSDAVSIMGTMSRECPGLSPVTVLNLPLKWTFQHLNEIRAARFAAAGREPLLFNPSDKVKNDWMIERNKQLLRN